MIERCRICYRLKLGPDEDAPDKCGREYSSECMVTVLVAARASTSNAEHDAERWMNIAEERGVKLVEVERHRRALALALRNCVDRLEAEFGRGGAVYDSTVLTRSPAAAANRNAIYAAVAALDDHA